MSRSRKPVAATRRYATDSRCEEQLAWLQRVSVLAISDGRAPSYSQLLRRAVGLLAEHIGALIDAGHLDGLPGPHPQDARAERGQLADYGRIVTGANTAPPRSLIDGTGRLLSWDEGTPTNADA